MATAVVIGTVIGSGVFKKPQAVAAVLPYFGLAMLAWVLIGLLALLGALAYAEVAVLFPRAGGNYVFLREGYGRLAGFLWGWVDFWIIRSASLAALATIFTESLHDVLTNRELQAALGLPGLQLGFWVQRFITVAVLVGLAAVNIRGVRWGGGLQLLITLVKVGSLLAIIVLPLLVLLGPTPATPEAARPAVANVQPIWPESWSQIKPSAFGAALLAVLWAFHGWMNIAPVAEEIRNPQRNIPLSLLGGVGCIIFLYLGANLAYSLVIPASEMAGMKATPVVTGFSMRLLGSLGVVAASGVVLCSVFGALNGNLLVGPRLLYAMGLDGLAPTWLGAVHARFQTPAPAIALMTCWASLLVLGVAILTQTGVLKDDKSAFDRLTDFAMFGAVIFETMAVMTIFVFRWRYPQAERPYRCPGYPLVPALYVVLPAFILVNTLVGEETWIEALTAVIFITAGAAVYFALGLYRRRDTA
jgi:amino acid transporter